MNSDYLDTAQRVQQQRLPRGPWPRACECPTVKMAPDVSPAPEFGWCLGCNGLVRILP